MACCPLAPDNDVLWPCSSAMQAVLLNAPWLPPAHSHTIHTGGGGNMCMKCVCVCPPLYRSAPSRWDPPPCGHVYNSKFLISRYFFSFIVVIFFVSKTSKSLKMLNESIACFFTFSQKCKCRRWLLRIVYGENIIFKKPKLWSVKCLFVSLLYKELIMRYSIT